MKRVAISFENVTKFYLKGAHYQPSFREWFGAIISGKTLYRPQDHFKALDSVSFEISRGSVVGFIGSNGAGKSTVLKLIANITYPNQGVLRISGSVAGLLELGTGFHEELTGEENVFVYGSILGLTKSQIKSIYPQIVSFSGLGEFMHMPVKHYSSGMYARLGFSVAIHVQPDILLIDEVLSVGDLSFKEKCMKFMREYCRDPKHTVIFVSHNSDNILQVCTEVIWIERGKIVGRGNPKKIINAYEKSQRKKR